MSVEITTGTAAEKGRINGCPKIGITKGAFFAERMSRISKVSRCSLENLWKNGHFLCILPDSWVSSLSRKSPESLDSGLSFEPLFQMTPPPPKFNLPNTSLSGPTARPPPIALQGIAIPIVPVLFRYRRVSRYAPLTFALSQPRGGGGRSYRSSSCPLGVSRYTGVSQRQYRLLMGH